MSKINLRSVLHCIFCYSESNKAPDLQNRTHSTLGLQGEVVQPIGFRGWLKFTLSPPACSKSGTFCKLSSQRSAKRTMSGSNKKMLKVPCYDEIESWESEWELVALTWGDQLPSATVVAVKGRGTRDRQWGQGKDGSPAWGQVTQTSAKEEQVGEVRTVMDWQSRNH